jgi:L-fucose isomerase-like protein
MKQQIKLGVMCLVRKTFDYPAAEQIYGRILEDLANLEATEVVAIRDMVIEIDEAKKSSRELLQHDIDALVVISGTFHLGHLVLEAQKILGVPILLWGLDELPYDGGKIRLNSVCGVNLNASNLYKAGVRDYYINIGEKIDEDWVDAIRIMSAFRDAHVGVAGHHAHGFFNTGYYPPSTARNFGVLVDHYELGDIFNYEVEESEIEERREQVRKIFDVTGISDYQLERVSTLTAKLNRFLDDKNLSAMAVRCWPEFADTFGISPCAAMSVLQSENRILSCEGDLDGALSMIAHRALGAETPFLFDFSQINFNENYALLWHCGVAPCNLWDGQSVRSLDTYFAGGRGVTADFVLKEGDISILRFDSVDGEYRLFLGKAKGVPMTKDLKGTYLKVVFDEPVREVFNRAVYNGIAHHASMVYGEYIRPLEIFAHIKNWRVIQ